MPGRMRRIPGRVVAGLVALVVLGAGITVATSPWSTAALPTLTTAQASYLTLAEHGVAQTSRWWDSKLGWYDDILDDHAKRPLASLWDTNGLFETLDEVAIAQPSSQNLAAVTSFANGSERYWDRYLKPVPGYAPYPGDSSPTQTTWFDDNGWIGLGFLDAYRATGSRRYLDDAERAFAVIAAEGWDAKQGGGMWWTTAHPERSGEALAAAADLAASLYQMTHKVTYLEHAETYIAWANKHLLGVRGVYLRVADTPYPYLIEPKTPKNGRATSPGSKQSVNCPKGSTGCIDCPHKAGSCKPPPGVMVNLGGPGSRNNKLPTMAPMPHDGEGAMVAAMTMLCEATGKQSWCKTAEKRAAAAIVWLAPFADGPQYDSVLVRGLLTLYAHDHHARWYRFAVAIARLIATHAETGPGVYLRDWDGRAVPSAVPGMLRTDAGSLSVFADLATVAPPS